MSDMVKKANQCKKMMRRDQNLGDKHNSWNDYNTY